MNKCIIMIVGLLLLSSFPLPARADQSRGTSGCRVRSNGIPINLLPDIVSNPKIIKNRTLDLEKLSDHNNPQYTNELPMLPGNGFIVYCSCKTKSSSPLKVLSAVTYEAKEGKYIPNSGVVRVESKDDMSQINRIFIITLHPNKIHKRDYSPTSVELNSAPTRFVFRGHGMTKEITFDPIIPREVGIEYGKGNISEKNDYTYIGISLNGSPPTLEESSLIDTDAKCE